MIRLIANALILVGLLLIGGYLWAAVIVPWDDSPGRNEGWAGLKYGIWLYLCTNPATILNFKAAALIQCLTCKPYRTSHNAHLHPDPL